MDAITDPYVQDVSVMSSAQIGKTTMLLCGIGYYIDYEPATQLLVLPTLSLSEKFSKTRLATMIQDVPVLSEKLLRQSQKTAIIRYYSNNMLEVTLFSRSEFSGFSFVHASADYMDG